MVVCIALYNVLRNKSHVFVKLYTFWFNWAKLSLKCLVYIWKCLSNITCEASQHRLCMLNTIDCNVSSSEPYQFILFMLFWKTIVWQSYVRRKRHSTSDVPRKWSKQWHGPSKFACYMLITSWEFVVIFSFNFLKLQIKHYCWMEGSLTTDNGMLCW